MDKFKRVMIEIGLFLLALIIVLGLVFAFSVSIDNAFSVFEPKQNPTHTLEIREVSKPPITIRDTITKVKTRSFRDSIYVPFEDSTRILKLMKERDSINLALIKFNVSENVKLDTVVEPTKDTVKMNYETLKKILDFEIRYSPRRDTVKSQIIYVPRNDFKTLALTGISGVIVGTILGLIIGK